MNGCHNIASDLAFPVGLLQIQRDFLHVKSDKHHDMNQNYTNTHTHIHTHMIAKSGRSQFRVAFD